MADHRTPGWGKHTKATTFHHPDYYIPKHAAGIYRADGHPLGQAFRVTHLTNGTEDADNNDPNIRTNRTTA